MLPGGNPLEAAIAAGETPSPEMVAAAPKKGALKPAIAIACLATVVLLFLFIAFYSERVRHHEWMPLEKSPEALTERADSIVKKLGYTKSPIDTDYGFEGDFFSYARTDQSPNHFERLRSGQPAVIYFWHRSSPRYLEPWYDINVLINDPPNDVAGMTKVILDVRGRLLEFQAVPPQVKDKTAQTSEVDWATLSRKLAWTSAITVKPNRNGRHRFRRRECVLGRHARRPRGHSRSHRSRRLSG